MTKIARSVAGTNESEVRDLTPEEEAEIAALIRGPVRVSGSESIDKIASSVGVTPTEVYRVELLQLTGYSINVTVIGVARDNGNIKKVSGDFTLERLNAAPIFIGETISVPHQNGTANVWKIDRSFIQDNGKYYGVIWVVGAAGRTIDWIVKGNMFRFTPSGVVRDTETVLPPPSNPDETVPPPPEIPVMPEEPSPIGEPEIFVDPFPFGEPE